MTPKPHTTGPQTAVVVGPPGEEIYTDKYGRVKVQFHWDRYGQMNENSSCWIRVSSPWAGANYGGIHIPRIGQEVVVDFLNGDGRRCHCRSRRCSGRHGCWSTRRCGHGHCWRGSCHCRWGGGGRWRWR